MENDDAERALAMAAAIADGDTVDWTAAGFETGNAIDALEGLRILEQISAANRRLIAEARSSERQVEPSSAPVGERGPLSSGTLGETLTADGHASGAATPEAGPAVEGMRWGSLRLIEKIGQGGFGEVYRAYDPGLHAEVALKLLRIGTHDDSRLQERFLDEARKLARVRHPNVLVVHGADRREGRVGLWTDLVHGETLQELLDARGPLGAREATIIGIDLCHALAAVHLAGLVHRDVKAANVMREQGGRILLMDFGTMADLVAGASKPGDGGIYGTPLMMAPEQLMGDPVGPAADIYGVGVLLYQLVSGGLPIAATTMDELFQRHARGERVPLRDRRPDLPAEFVRVVEQCLDSDPGRRYASAGALESALASSAGLHHESHAPPPPRPWNTHAALATAIVVASAIVALVVVHPWRARDERSTHDTIGAPHPTTSLAATATLFRVANGAEQELLPGARVEPGNRLSLRYECAESSFVYVVDEDEHGQAFVLFPVPGIEPANPLPPGRPHRLPGTLGGKRATWQVTSAGGTESILVVASRHPLVDLEHDLASLLPVRPGQTPRYPTLSPHARLALRGIGGIASDTAVAGSPGRLSEALAHVPSDDSGPRDVWIWQTQLANPAPR